MSMLGAIKLDAVNINHPDAIAPRVGAGGAWDDRKNLNVPDQFNPFQVCAKVAYKQCILIQRDYPRHS